MYVSPTLVDKVVLNSAIFSISEIAEKVADAIKHAYQGHQKSPQKKRGLDARKLTLFMKVLCLPNMESKVSEYDPQYLVHVQQGEEPSYLVGPLTSPDETVNWIYNQIGSLTAVFPQAKLEKLKWDYVIDTSEFMKKHIVDIELRFGDYHLKTLEMKNPKYVRIHPECKVVRDRHKSGELTQEIF